MRTSLTSLVLAAAIVLPAAALAQANPCAENTCKVIFDWGGTIPDVDKRFGAPSTMESTFLGTLGSAGWKVSPSVATTPLTMTVRLTKQERAMCDQMSGVNPDMSCHTVSRAAIIFTANDSTQKPVPRVEVAPHCSDPKSNPTFVQFGQYAAEYVTYMIVNEGKGQRPSLKCR